MKANGSSMTQNTRSAGFRQVIGSLIRFSLPLILSGILQQLYSWADAFIVGNVEGEVALGAIGGTGTVINFYLLTITGFTVGLSVLFGQAFGSGDHDAISKGLTSFAILLGGAYTVFAVAGSLNARGILSLLHTTPETIALAGSYLRIVLLGIPFLAVYNVYFAALRGIGDSRVPFYAVLISSCANVALDIFFVAVLRLGVNGAAAATVLSQAAMTVYVVIYASKKHPLLHLRRGAFDRKVMRRGFHFGIPTMLQSSITACGNLLLQNFMNSFGTATVIAITTSYRVDSLMLLPVINMGSAISALSAQSYGARDPRRLNRIRSAGLLVILAESVLLTALVIPFGSRLIAAFGAGAEAVRIGHEFFLRLASFYIVFGLLIGMRGYLEGIGDVMYSSAIGIICLATRIGMSYLLRPLFGNHVIAYAEAISWGVGLLLYAIRLRQKRALPEMQNGEGKAC